jgi:hypothetical protein
LTGFLNAQVAKFNERTSEEKYHHKTGLPTITQRNEAEQDLSGLSDSFHRCYLNEERIQPQVYVWSPKEPSHLPTVQHSEGGLFSGVATKKSKPTIEYKTIKQLLIELQTAAIIKTTLERGEKYPFSSFTTSENPDADSLFAHQMTENHTPAILEYPADWNVDGEEATIDSIIKVPKYWYDEDPKVFLMIIKNCRRKSGHPLDIDSSNLAEPYGKYSKSIAQIAKDEKYRIKGKSTASGLVLSMNNFFRYLFTVTTSKGRIKQYMIKQ